MQFRAGAARKHAHTGDLHGECGEVQQAYLQQMTAVARSQRQIDWPRDKIGPDKFSIVP